MSCENGWHGCESMLLAKEAFSVGVGLVGNGAVADGQDAHKAMPLVELVDDPVRPDAKGSESA